jgi:hypothetical protein
VVSYEVDIGKLTAHQQVPQTRAAVLEFVREQFRARRAA